VFVRKLRAKLQKHSPGWEYIHTHFGVGYRFEPEGEAGVEAVAGAEPQREPIDFDVEAEHVRKAAAASS
jgi:hypothetical protein